jgi:hypothetical protein
MSFAQEIKDFTGGLQAGWKLGKPDKEAYYDKWRQEDYGRADAEKAKEQAGLQAGEDNATPGAVGLHPTVSGGAIPSAAPSFAAGSGGGGAGRAMRMPQATDNPELVKSVVEESKKYGLDPAHVLTAMSYETGGTFDPWKAGPTTRWGQHRGLIQWGEPQRSQYGVDQNTPVGDQVKATFQYLKDRGVRPGAGLMDIYSAINAGRVGRNNASDAAAGGAPGTVANKVNTQMGGHAARARSMLQKFGSGASANAGYASAIPAAAGLLPDSLTAGDGSPVRQVLPGGQDPSPAPVQRFAEGGLVRAIPEDDYETWAPRPDNEVRPPRRPQALPVRGDVPTPPPRPQDERVAEGTPTPPARPDDLPRGYDPSTDKLRQVARQTGADDGREEVARAPHPPARPSDLTAKVAATLGIPWKDPPRPFKSGERVPTPPGRPGLSADTREWTDPPRRDADAREWTDPPRPASEYASLPAEPDTGDRNDWEDGGPTPIPNDLSGKNPPLPPRRPTNLAAAPQGAPPGAPQAVTPQGKPAPMPPRRPQALDLSYSDLPPRPAAPAAQPAPQTSAPQGAPDYTSSERAGTGGEAGSYWANVGANHVNDAVHAGLTYLSSTGAGASAPRQAIPTAGLAAQPLQPPSPQEVRAVDQALDPSKKLTPDERTMARLYGGYQYFMNKGDVQGAQRYAAGMLLHSKSIIGHAGAVAQVALQHGDVQGAANAIAQGYSAHPDGKSVKVLSVGPDGVQYAIVDDRTGQQVDQRRAALNDMMAVATGMSNGSAWLDAIEQGFTPQGKPGAARGQTPERIAQMARQADQRDRAMDQRDRALSQRDGAGGTGKSKTKSPAEPEYDSDVVKAVDETLKADPATKQMPDQGRFALRTLTSNLSRYNEMEPDEALSAARGLLTGDFQLGENNTVTSSDGQQFRLNPRGLDALKRLKRWKDEQGKSAGAGTKTATPENPIAARNRQAVEATRAASDRSRADRTAATNERTRKALDTRLGTDAPSTPDLTASRRLMKDKRYEEERGLSESYNQQRPAFLSPLDR